MLNEFYNNIPEWLRQPINNAINTAEQEDEEHIITPLNTLIGLLGSGFNSNEAVNRYMTDPVTRHSVTRRFFFPHTLPGNLYPEDLAIYTYPPPPAGMARLVLAPAPAFVRPPPIDLMAEAFAADPDDDFFDELSPLAMSVSNQALIVALNHPPRIDSFFQPGVAEAIATISRQEPDPEQAQAPRVVQRILPNNLECEIYE
jgi:hypothetical protein